MSSINKEKLDFANRMNEVCDKLEIPPKGQNRQQLLGKKFGVTQKGARKWLEGESIPGMDKCIEIAKEANVRFEWFMTGRGPRDYTLEKDELQAKHADFIKLISDTLKTREKIPEHIQSAILTLISGTPHLPDIAKQILNAEGLVETPRKVKENS